MAPEDSSEILRGIHEIRGRLDRVNAHLEKLNGKVAAHDDWIKIRTDREQRSSEQSSKAVTTKQLYIAVAGFALALLTVVLGAHGIS